MDEKMERLRAIAATRSWRSDASVRLSDLCAMLETYDALVAALGAARVEIVQRYVERHNGRDGLPREAVEEESELIPAVRKIDAALALARKGG